MIKIQSKKLRNVLHKDSNKLSVRKRYQINKFESHHRLNIGINLYFKSIEDLELYKDEEVWCVGCVENGGVYIISNKFTEDFEPIPNMTIKECISMINSYYSLYKHKKFILIKSVDELITIPEIQF